MPYLLLGGLSLFFIGMLNTRLKMVTPEDKEELNNDCINTKCDYLRYIEHGKFNY